MTKQIAELVICHCKSGCKKNSCSCRKNNFRCTDACCCVDCENYESDFEDDTYDEDCYDSDE